jgi:long-subunit fatty acid transport protein
LSNPSNPGFGALLGPRFPERFPLEWDDSVAVRLGFQRRFCNGSVFRTGYVYHPNPIPDETLTPFIQSIVEHTVSVGYGWTKGKCQIDVGYQYMFGPDQYVGTSGFIGGDFDQSRTTAGAHWLLTSVSRRF